MNTPIYIPMTVSADTASIPMTVSASAVVLPVALDVTIATSTAPDYDGPYEFTPSQNAQTVLISGMLATQDITIDPIPSNYGLVTWNGSILTVS